MAVQSVKFVSFFVDSFEDEVVAIDGEEFPAGTTVNDLVDGDVRFFKYPSVDASGNYTFDLCCAEENTPGAIVATLKKAVTEQLYDCASNDFFGGRPVGR